jgi:hypothetical protein
MDSNKIFSESLILSIKESVSKPEIVVEKLRKIKARNISGTVVFKATDKNNDLINIDVYQLDKRMKKIHIMTIHNVFSHELISNKGSGIEASFELAERFSKIFKKTKLQKAQFYFTYHDETRGYNLNSGRWEKFI